MIQLSPMFFNHFNHFDTCIVTHPLHIMTQLAFCVFFFVEYITKVGRKRPKHVAALPHVCVFYLGLTIPQLLEYIHMTTTKEFYEQKQLENLRHYCCISSPSILWEVMQLTSGYRFIAVACSNVQVRPSMSHDITISIGLQKTLPGSHYLECSTQTIYLQYL